MRITYQVPGICQRSALQIPPDSSNSEFDTASIYCAGTRISKLCILSTIPSISDVCTCARGYVLAKLPVTRTHGISVLSTAEILEYVDRQYKVVVVQDLRYSP